MATQTRSGCHNFADFLELISEDQKADLINGVIYIASPENIEPTTSSRGFVRFSGNTWNIDNSAV